MTSKQKTVALAVFKAYSDCHTASMEGRELNFRASEAVDGETLKATMSVAVPDGYNGFDESAVDRVVEFFGPDAEYIIARESSVCLYVKPANRVWLKRGQTVDRLADEVSFEPDGTFRLWWD